MAEVVTIGAYGWSAVSFFDALVGERVGVFVDIRRRRGVRGAEYAFVNSTRLQGRLRELGIEYLHRLDLAPSARLRQVQAALDERMGVAKRVRSRLGPEFAAAYAEECLVGFDAAAFLGEVGTHGPICLFCVERSREACHRSLVAERLADGGATLRPLVP